MFFPTTATDVCFCASVLQLRRHIQDHQTKIHLGWVFSLMMLMKQLLKMGPLVSAESWCVFQHKHKLLFICQRPLAALFACLDMQRWASKATTQQTMLQSELYVWTLMMLMMVSCSGWCCFEMLFNVGILYSFWNQCWWVIPLDFNNVLLIDFF